ncbi:MAG: hypothetical protein QME50_04020 [Candidatus Bathyarchaeota archaeon]|nr:hypothetical protein [Candidatus Bathyarchaeota archaeon]
MSEKMELRVGKKGEIYTTHEVREKVGIMPGGKVLASIRGHELVVQPKLTALSLLEKPRINVEPLRLEELSKLRKELAERLEAR